MTAKASQEIIDKALESGLKSDISVKIKSAKDGWAIVDITYLVKGGSIQKVCDIAVPEGTELIIPNLWINPA